MDPRVLVLVFFLLFATTAPPAHPQMGTKAASGKHFSALVRPKTIPFEQTINKHTATHTPADGQWAVHSFQSNDVVHNEQICLGRPPRSIQATWWVVNN